MYYYKSVLQFQAFFFSVKWSIHHSFDFPKSKKTKKSRSNNGPNFSTSVPRLTFKNFVPRLDGGNPDPGLFQDPTIF
jgi:hypothetical protein